MCSVRDSTSCPRARGLPSWPRWRSCLKRRLSECLAGAMEHSLTCTSTSEISKRRTNEWLNEFAGHHEESARQGAAVQTQKTPLLSQRPNLRRQRGTLICGRGETRTHRPLKPARSSRRLRVQIPPSAHNFILVRKPLKVKAKKMP